jgi:hypothetical protein
LHGKDPASAISPNMTDDNEDYFATRLDLICVRHPGKLILIALATFECGSRLQNNGSVFASFGL